MTITLNIRPEVQAELERQAASQGRALEAVAAALLEEAVHVPPPVASTAPANNLVELFEPIRGLLTDEKLMLSSDAILRPVALLIFINGFLLDSLPESVHHVPGTLCVGCHRYIPIVAHALAMVCVIIVKWTPGSC